MKEIKLTQNQVALVDDWNHDYLSQWTWCARWDKTTRSFYAVCHDKSFHQKTLYMSRIVMNTPSGMICDHINHNTLDNREENLRNVTTSQSVMNRRMRHDNGTGEKNISLHSSGKGFNVRIASNGKRIYKYYLSFADAIKARNLLTVEYHGEFGTNKND